MQKDSSCIPVVSLNAESVIPMEYRYSGGFAVFRWFGYEQKAGYSSGISLFRWIRG